MNHRSLCLSGITLLLSVFLHAQNSSNEAHSPFSFATSYIGDGVTNFSGGLKRGSTYLGIVNLRLSFDTEKAGIWKGGLLYVDGANTHGGTPSENLVGDFQIVSNIEAGNMTYVHALWYSQRFGRFSTILGLQDLNAQFASSESAGLFLNSSFGVHSTISNNIPSPIFPLTALGWQFEYLFSDKLNGKLALFDGLPEGYKHNTHNLSWKLDPNEGYLLITEFTYRSGFSESTPGTYKLGAYYHNHYDFANKPDSLGVRNHENEGLYLVADQTLFQCSDGRKVSLFAQASVSPKSINTNCNYLGLGFNFTGLIKGRTEDVLGMALARAGFRDGVFPGESTLECTYKAQLNPHFFVQPDIQYVMHPSGTDQKTGNALVGILRFGLNY